jgi:DNA-binding protein HU-beta
MNKSQLIDALAEKAEMSRAAAARAVEGIFGAAEGAVSSAVRQAGKLSLPGFGKFVRRERPARKGRNPRTGAVIHVPKRTTVTFVPGKTLRDTLADANAPTVRKGNKRGR